MTTKLIPSSSSSSSWLSSSNNDKIEATLIIATLYEALAKGDSAAAAGLIAADDLEYWFHGPPRCHHMMRALTGQTAGPAFRFQPRSVCAVGGSTRVVAEGWEGPEAYWVHVWTVEAGAVTQLREYFNTWLTVRDLRGPPSGLSRGGHVSWQSMPTDLFRRSLPGLLLAI